jgi:Zn finger protein HypA/HybF involved in hydrogenase expression
VSGSHPKCWGPDGHVCQKPSGRKCIDCGQPAGTDWGPYWCPDCDVKRLDKISDNLESIVAALSGVGKPGHP